MLCDRCKKNIATNYYKQNINGKVYEYNLCDECTQNLSHTNIFLDDLLNGLLYSGHNIPLKNNRKLRCEKCGSTMDDIRSSGKIGCSKCYEIFKAELMPSIRKLHINTTHIGNTPSSFLPNLSPNIAKLESKLSEAIKKQEFELAAQIRDQINELRRGEMKNE